MKWVKFRQEGNVGWGQVCSEQGSDFIQVYTGTPFKDGCRPLQGRERLPLDTTPLLAPCAPTKIVCIGRNFGAHARELGHTAPPEPMFFLKPPSALLDPGGTILLPALSQQVEYEAELALVMRRRLSRFSASADPSPFLLGYTCLNDVTARDLQKRDLLFTRAKGFDTFCPLGPWVEDAPQPGPQPWHGLQIETRVNGELRQQGNTRDFLFSLPQLLAAVTAVMTLEPGDVLATGTPAGVSALLPGDRVRITVAGIGSLENPVAAAAQ
ncbi:MAG: fumarylacetoacetate hydrolase family protein [Terriglobales bacterium]